MSILLGMVDERLEAEKPNRPTRPYLITADVLYADDTLLIAREPEVLQAHLDLVIDVGKNYGLELNAGKTILLKIRSNGVVHGPDGKNIACRE
eukprot:6560086-Pyramimonas_sp.AAC.1